MIHSYRFTQYAAALTASGFVMAIYFHVMWGSPMIPKLRNDTTLLSTSITDDEASWTASMLYLIAVPSTLLAPPIIRRFGLLVCLEISGILMFIPWIIYITTNSMIWIFIGRAFPGVASGLVISGSLMYIGEISDPDIRGFLLSMFGISKLIGTIITLMVGPVVSYRNFSIISAVLTSLPIIFFWFMPESPYHLARQADDERGKKMLRKLQPPSVDDTELNAKWEAIKSSVQDSFVNRGGFHDFATKGDYRRANIIMFVIRTLQVLSGMMLIEWCLQTIVEKTHSSFSPETSSMIFGVVQFPGTILCSLSIEKLGRKPILIISLIGCAVTSLVEGIFFFLQDYLQEDISSIAWLPTTALALYIFFSVLGIANLPYTLFGECFSPNIKEVSLTAITFYGQFLTGAAQKLVVPITNHFGYYTLFWIFTGVCTLGIVFVCICLPETKGKTFIEIQRKINKQKVIATIS